MSAIISWNTHQWRYYYARLFPVVMRDEYVGPDKMFKFVPIKRDIFLLKIRWGDTTENSTDDVMILDAVQIFSQPAAKTFCEAIRSAYPIAKLDDDQFGDPIHLMNHWGLRPSGKTVSFSDGHLQNIMEAVTIYTQEVLHSNYVAYTALPVLACRLKCLTEWVPDLLSHFDFKTGGYTKDLMFVDESMTKVMSFREVLAFIDIALIKLCFPEAPIVNKQWEHYDQKGEVIKRIKKYVTRLKTKVWLTNGWNRRWVCDDNGSFALMLQDTGEQIVAARKYHKPSPPETRSDDKYREMGPFVCHARCRQHILESIHKMTVVLHGGNAHINRHALVQTAFGLAKVCGIAGPVKREETRYWRSVSYSYTLN